MKVSDLIEALEEMDPEAEVVMHEHFTADYVPVEDVSGFYVYSPEVGCIKFRKLSPAIRNMGYTEADVWDPKELPDAIPCVVLYT